MRDVDKFRFKAQAGRREFEFGVIPEVIVRQVIRSEKADLGNEFGGGNIVAMVDNQQPERQTAAFVVQQQPEAVKQFCRFIGSRVI